MELPLSPTKQQLEILEEYLKQVKKDESKSEYGTRNYYKEREEIISKKLIIFKNSQVKSDIWYLRFYVGNKKYKTISLRTSIKQQAVEKALEKWRSLQNHLESGGDVFESGVQQCIDRYLLHLDQLVTTGQIKKHTVQTKKTSLNKLRLFLQNSDKPSDIPPLVFNNYVAWRRTKNWDKSKHKNNSSPPTDATINKELCDFKTFFDWCKKQKIYVKEIEYPFLKIDWSKSIEKNPAFEIEDWKIIVYYLRTWVKKSSNANGNEIKNPFYRNVFGEFLKVLANSGLRIHECLLLRWSDVQLKSKMEFSTSSPDKKRQRLIAHIQVSPDTKTGRRLVICAAGDYFKRIHKLYRDKEGRSPRKDEFIFRNIGTTHSRTDQFVGLALSDTFFRKLWYSFKEDVQREKDIVFNHNYTLYSCRAFFINQRLEIGVPPAIVAELVGHSIKTMERHYKNIRLKQLEPDLVQIRKNELRELDFQTYDLD